jgi:hypothetical protein
MEVIFSKNLSPDFSHYYNINNGNFLSTLSKVGGEQEQPSDSFVPFPSGLADLADKHPPLALPALAIFVRFSC